VGIFNKVFGDLFYQPSLSKYPGDYQVNRLEETIVNTER